MFKHKRFLTLGGAALIAALALGLMAFSAVPAIAPTASAHGRGGGPGGPGNAEYLAEALGITVDELTAAQEQAQQAALQQLVDAGLLTEAQAEWLQERGGRLPFGLGEPGGMENPVDREALLAEALGISVEELQAAQEQAFELGLEDAIANGNLTAEQADLMRAQRALKDYIDREALTAQALGISVEELQAARDEGTRIPDLLDELGLTAEEFRTTLQAAHEAALQQAVEDGVITAEQAEALQNAPGRMPGFGGRGGRGGHPGGGRGGAFPQMPFGDGEAPVTPEDAPTAGDIL